MLRSKTAYLCCLAVFTLFLVSSPRPLLANAQSCGTAAHFYSAGSNTDTYSKYGVSTTQQIYSQTICGTTSTTGSQVVNFIGVNWADNQFVAVGYSQGIEPNGHWTGSSQDYYWDRYYCVLFSCNYYFSDISSGVNIYPQAGDSIQFQLQGSLNTGAHDWYITITKSGSYTININNIAAEGDYAPYSIAETESHNNANTATALYNYLNNLKQTSSNGWTWTTWTSSNGFRSPNNSSNPYCYTEDSVSEYNIYTNFGGC
ncbi:MAG: hypothetical protein JRN15_11535 [Nitrososphaerota archaeon]|nr:hypothetical protein [Nitrososphaerota archaeon]